MSILFDGSGVFYIGFDGGGPEDLVDLIEYLGVENIYDFITERKLPNGRMEYNILINQ